MEEKSSRILFIYTRTSTFINGDLDILSGRHIVTSLEVDNSTPSKQLFALIKEFFFLLANIKSYDVVYIWFADYHSFLPALFAKLAGKRCRYYSLHNHFIELISQYESTKITFKY
jgi:hypothetical protein